MTGCTSRRSLLGGLASLLPAGAAVASTRAAGPHPDALLLALKKELAAADSAKDRATQEYREASAAANRAIPVCPPELFVNNDDKAVFREGGGFTAIRFGGLGRQFRPGDEPHKPSEFWTYNGLMRARAIAPAELGRAGRTPFRIARWRGLVPVAHAHDEQRKEVWRAYRTKEFHEAERQATAARNELRKVIQNIPAKTIDGLRVQVELFDGYYLGKLNRTWGSLLLSAIAITGAQITLNEVQEYEEEARL